MKILVPIKRVIDPYIAIRIDKDELHVVSENIPHAMNPFDETALSEAAALKNALPELEIEIIVASIGPAATKETLRTALAMGADRAIHVLCKQPLEPLAIAKLLKILVDEIKPDLVFMGKQSADGDNGQTGPMLAGLLDWPQACSASSILLHEKQVPEDGFGTVGPGLARLILEKEEENDPDAIIVISEVENGLASRVLTLPALVTCDTRLNTPKPLSLAQVMKAKHSLIEQRKSSDMTTELTPRLAIVKISEPPQRPPCQIFDQASELVAQLRKRDLL
ncbi:MAG: electron transfer flavoprotein subunit beta/FixA family protein [Hyphomicrobiaceae bacterium]|nr:electron transfer flavoprotein subunit beta/FixA family protein [Hyphomicrobiaceae bacterium]